MSYQQITAAERYTLTLLRRQGLCAAAIARILGRHRSTSGREVRRNTTRHDGWYRAEKAHSSAIDRRARSRRNQRFGPAAWRLVRARLAEEWSPEQIAGRLAVDGTLSISHDGGGSRANGTSPTGPRRPPLAPNSDTGKGTRCWGPARRAPAC